MDFLNFFGFKDDPFRLTPDPSYFYPSVSHNEGLMLLDYAIQQKEGFCLIIGDPGTGKTTLLNVFLERWGSKAEIAIILTPRLSPEEFLISVVEDLNIALENKNKNEIIKAFRDFLIEKSAEDRRVIIIVDEAQNLPDETLEELRLLSNIETDKEKLLQIILIGQPELESRLKTEQLRQLDQRITTRIHLQPFSSEEAEDYINYRMIKAGRHNFSIHKNAKILLYKSSKGIPRLINIIFSRTLMAAYLEETNTILLKHIHYAVKSLNHNEIRVQRNLLMPVSAVVLSIVLMVVVYILLSQPKFQITNSRLQINPISQITPDTFKQNNDIHIPKSQISQSPNLPPPLSLTQSKSQNKVAEPTISKDKIASSNRAAEQQSSRAAVNATNVTNSTPAFKILSIKSDTADIRETPSVSSKTVGTSLKSNQFVVLEESVDDQNMRWYQVFYEGEKRWVSGEAADIIEIKTEQKSNRAEEQ